MLLNPWFYIFYNNNENKFKAQENYNKALTALDINQKIGFYNKAIELDPNYKETYKSKADTLITLKRYAEAIECYDQVQQLEPNDSEAFNFKGLALNELYKLF